MALTAAEVIARSVGDVYTAPDGTAAPALADLGDMAALELAGWVHNGWIHEDGPSWDGFEPVVESIPGWNRQGSIKKRYELSEEAFVGVPFLQWNAENLALYFPGATHDAVTSTIKVTNYASPTPQALLVVVGDGSRFVGFWASSTSPRGSDAITFPDDNGAPIPVAFDILSPSSGDTFQFIGIDVAA